MNALPQDKDRFGLADGPARPGFVSQYGLKRFGGSLLAGLALVLIPAAIPVSLLLPATQVEAQNFSQRVVQGKAVDDTGTAIAGATVFLKNDKTRGVKSYTTDAQGSFRFAQVGMIDDYDVWAEHGGKKSAIKTISSFDSRTQVDVELKLK